MHGAGGAVGTAMLQLARDAGISAFGTDTAAKRDLIRSLGAEPIDADAADLEAAIAEAVGNGVDVVFDPLGGDSLSRSVHALKPGGMLVAFGFTNEVLGRGGSIPWDFVRLTLWDWLPNGHATAFYSIGAMDGSIRSGSARISPRSWGCSPAERSRRSSRKSCRFEEVRRAHEMIEAGTARGKLVLRVSASGE